MNLANQASLKSFGFGDNRVQTDRNKESSLRNKESSCSLSQMNETQGSYRLLPSKIPLVKMNTGN